MIIYYRRQEKRIIDSIQKVEKIYFEKTKTCYLLSDKYSTVYLKHGKMYPTHYLQILQQQKSCIRIWTLDTVDSLVSNSAGHALFSTVFLPTRRRKFTYTFRDMNMYDQRQRVTLAFFCRVNDF